ncbi:MAG: endonuclease III, partial [Bacillota bacterium]
MVNRLDEKLDVMINILEEKYPKPETELNHNSPFELLVATILSAQTTD